jgi:hypothetical protein
MPSPSRKLTLEDLTAARRLYEAGASYRVVAAQYDVSPDTVARMLKSVGVQSRPIGWPQRPKPEPVPPQPRSAVQIAPDVTGRLRIPWRTMEERRVRAWTPAERQAIAVDLAAGRVAVVRRGHSGLPERRTLAQATATAVAFRWAMERLKAA